MNRKDVNLIELYEKLFKTYEDLRNMKRRYYAIKKLNCTLDNDNKRLERENKYLHSLIDLITEEIGEVEYC